MSLDIARGKNSRFQKRSREFILRLPLIILICFSLLFSLLAEFSAFANGPAVEVQSSVPKIKVLTTCYFAHRWSDEGAYRRVSQKGKRLGNFVALNFLPAGSIIMIPELLKTTKLEVADTLGGRGVGRWKGKKFWKVDILRNKAEWLDDFDHPLELVIVKINPSGRLRDRIIKQNYQAFLKQGRR